MYCTHVSLKKLVDGNRRAFIHAHSFIFFILFFFFFIYLFLFLFFFFGRTILGKKCMKTKYNKWRNFRKQKRSSNSIKIHAVLQNETGILNNQC